MYYLFCLIKYLFGFVNMLFVFVYFIFNDLGIKRLYYIFRSYFVDFFFIYLVSVFWLVFFCEYLVDGFIFLDFFYLKKFDY